jgi:hypothetical protein
MRRILLIAAALSALAANASTLRLVEPRQGLTLRGGSQATIEWSATSLPAHAEEWEAFLSLDGGKYYAFRITPHLDLDLRRVTWIVPNVDTKNARLLIRTGDERRETLFEFSTIFSIARDPNAEQVVRHLIRFGRGEAAREGDAPVVAWADGARNGGGITQQYATTSHPRALVPRVRVVRETTSAIVPAANLIETRSILSSLDIGRDAHARQADSVLPAVDLLLVCRRRNV